MHVVTGATGFLGHALLRHALEKATPAASRVAVLLRRGQADLAQFPPSWRPRLHPIEGDLHDPTAWLSRLGALGISGIFHLAAVVEHSQRAAGRMDRINTQASVAIAQAAGAHRVRCVFVSTSGAVGCSTDPHLRPDEHAPFAWATAGRWPYYRSKMRAEQQMRAILPRPDQLVIVRPPVMLGPGDTRYRSTGTVVRLLRGRLPFVLAGGMACIDVRDVAPALWAAMHRGPPVQPIYHLPGHALSLRDYFAAIARLAHRRAPRRVLPRVAAMALAHASVVLHRAMPKRVPHPFLEPVLAQMGQHYWGVQSRYAHRDLGLRERGLSETLRDTIADLCQRRDDCGPWPP